MKLLIIYDIKCFRKRASMYEKKRLLRLGIVLRVYETNECHKCPMECDSLQMTAQGYLSGRSDLLP